MNNCYPGNQCLAKNKAYRVTQLSWYMRNGNQEDYCKGDQVRDIGRRAQGKLWEQPFPRSQAPAQLPGKDLFSIHPFHENENRQRGRPDALVERELCGAEAFFFILLETGGWGSSIKHPVIATAKIYITRTPHKSRLFANYLSDFSLLLFSFFRLWYL